MKNNNKLALNPDAMELLADRFRVLSKPIRLQILQVLQDEMLTVSDITKAVQSTQPNVSKHLKILQDGGILGRKQKGNAVYYWVLDKGTFHLCNLVLTRLGDHIESKTRLLESVE